jgi:hypothetical protein
MFIIIGNTGTFRGKPRRNARACGRQYLRSATCHSVAATAPTTDITSAPVLLLF